MLGPTGKVGLSLGRSSQCRIIWWTSSGGRSKRGKGRTTSAGETSPGDGEEVEERQPILVQFRLRNTRG